LVNRARLLPESATFSNGTDGGSRTGNKMDNAVTGYPPYVEYKGSEWEGRNHRKSTNNGTETG